MNDHKTNRHDITPLIKELKNISSEIFNAGQDAPDIVTQDELYRAAEMVNDAEQILRKVLKEFPL